MYSVFTHGFEPFDPRVSPPSCPTQRGVHLDQPAGGGGGAVTGRSRKPWTWCPLVTNVVLEEHYLIVGVVVVVDIGVIPINSRGREAADASARRLPGRPAGPHLRGLQHVSVAGETLSLPGPEREREREREGEEKEEEEEEEEEGGGGGGEGGQISAAAPLSHVSALRGVTP